MLNILTRVGSLLVYSGLSKPATMQLDSSLCHSLLTMLLVCSIMLNILGESSGLEGKQAAEDLMSRALQVRLVLLKTKCMYHLRMCVLHVA